MTQQIAEEHPISMPHDSMPDGAPSSAAASPITNRNLLRYLSMPRPALMLRDASDSYAGSDFP